MYVTGKAIPAELNDILAELGAAEEDAPISLGPEEPTPAPKEAVADDKEDASNAEDHEEDDWGFDDADDNAGDAPVATGKLIGHLGQYALCG